MALNSMVGADISARMVKRLAFYGKHAKWYQAKLLKASNVEVVEVPFPVKSAQTSFGIPL